MLGNTGKLWLYCHRYVKLSKIKKAFEEFHSLLQCKWEGKYFKKMYVILK